MYAPRVLEFSVMKIFIKFAVEAIPHCLDMPLPLLFEQYKKAPQPFSQKDTLNLL